ncbi:MAG: hypothetical protein ACKV22_15875 [Bryobacteraceae bacterium]
MSLKSFIPLLLVGAAGLAQQAPPQARTLEAKPSPLAKAGPVELKVAVIAGEGSANNIKAKVAAQPAVEVRDEKGQPVSGAEVIFQLPASGPGGQFFGTLRSHTVRTNEQGQAKASGLTPNEELGKFQIRVTATLGPKTAEAFVNQSNGSGPTTSMKSNKKAVWTVVAVAAVGAIIGGVAAASGDDNSTTTAAAVPVTVSAGPITVGGPR